MSGKESLHGYMFAQKAAEDRVQDIQYQISNCRTELSKLESKLVGAKNELERAKNNVHRNLSTSVREEISARDVEIAAMKGIYLVLGEPMNAQLRKVIRDTPPLPQFSKD